MKFSCIISFYEWARRWGTWGKPGVYKILDILQHAGIKRVYLRMRQAQCYYPSRVDEPGIHFDEENNILMWSPQSWEYNADDYKWMNLSISFRDFDPTPVFIKRGHEIGIEVYAWLEQVEDHAWGWPSGFSRRHPEFLTRNRDGMVCNGTLGWAYPEVLDFKLSLVREVLEYGFNGVAIGFTKGGDHRIPRWDEDGVWFAGYDPPALKAFKGKTGRDPLRIPNDDAEWLQYLADLVTEFLRRARKMQQTSFPSIKLGAFCAVDGLSVLSRAPFDPIDPDDPELMKGNRERPIARMPDPLAGNLEDHEAWSKNRLLDFAIATIRPGAMDLDKPVQEYLDVASRFGARFAHGEHVGVFKTVYFQRPDEFRQQISQDAEIGALEVVLFQGFAIEERRAWNVLREMTEKYRD